MLRLDTTTRTLEITLAGAVTTNQLPVVVCYSDQTASTYNGNTQLSVTNNTTPVTIASAPGASTNRDIDYLSVWNRDTAIATVIIVLNDNSTLYTIARVTLAVGEQLIYTHGDGWRTITVNGQLKTAASTGSMALDDLTDVIITTPAAGAILTYNGTEWVDGQVDLTDADAVTGTLGIGNGGTGSSATPTNGQLLIGNGTGFSLNALTAGAGISIINGAGTITINSSSSSVALSSITAAVAANSINNDDHAQTWNWALTTAAKSAFTFTENVASTGGAGSQYLLDIGTINASTANPIRIRAEGADIFNVTNVGVVTLQGADNTPGRAMTVRAGNSLTGNTAGPALSLVGGAGNGSGTGGAANLTGGNVTGAGINAVGGAVNITGGQGAGNQSGGAVNVLGGSTTGGNAAGAAVTITAGPSNGSGTGGAVTIAGGSAPGTGLAGGVTVQGGTPTNNNGGTVNIAGSAGVGTNRSGGNVTITGGANTGTGTAGYINLVTTTGTMLFAGTTGLRVGANVALTNPAVSLSIDGTDAVLVPLGTTAQRPTGVEGYLRYNSTTDKFEGFENSAWRSFVTASAGSATLELYRESFTGTPTLQATGTNAQAFGDGASAYLYGAFTDSNGSFAAVGDAQTTTCVLRCTTTNTAATTEMFLDGAAATQRMVLPNDSTWTFDILVTARRTDANDSSAGYRFVGVIDRNATAGSTALVGTVSKTVLAEDTAAYDCNVNADTTNGALRIQVNGTGTHTIRWVARVTLVEVTG